MKKALAFFLAVMMSLPMVQGAIKVHTIGDSTMAEYDESTTDKRGWCMFLGSFFDADNVTVNNRGKSGADTRGFYTGAAYWPSVKNQMSAGDYLLIQFAHNDEGADSNLSGLDHDEYAAYCAEHGLPAPTDERGTNPKTTYRDFLRKFIDEARALGVNPVLVAPICRAYFASGDIKRNGRHDLGDKFAKIENGVLYQNQSVPASDLSMSYVEAMRIVAEEKNVPFIDLTQATRELFLSYGETQCLNLLFCTGDKTHTNAMGGNLIARKAAELLKAAGILADYIDIPESISASPTSIVLGEIYTGVAQNKEILLTGYGLNPETGTVSIEATGELTVSIDKESFAKTASVNYTGGSLFQKIYVRALYTEAGEKSDKVVFTCGSASFEVPVTASVISLDGGSAVSATWALDAIPVADAVFEGPISAAFSMNHMMANNYQAGFTIGDDTNASMIRFHNADDNGTKTAWPAGEIDENASRYLDFALTAPSTMNVRVTGISMDIAAHSTSTMCYHINTGFGDGFTDVKTIGEKVNMTNLVAESLVLTPMLTIKAGETLHVRILPWHNLGEAKSGKYICLKNVKIEGQAFEPGQGFENTKDSLQSEKRIENGQLVIIKNGVKYNAQGAVIR